MASGGWHKLIPSTPPFVGEGEYRIDAYSEFMPPPRVGWKPYGIHPIDDGILHADDPHGWYVNEWQEAFELRPGLDQVAKQVIHRLQRLLQGEAALPKMDLVDNPYWPTELAQHPRLKSDHGVVMMPLALSRTLDDKGRIRWTLFGNSEQGPGKPFWKSFWITPRKEAPAKAGIDFFCRLLASGLGETVEGEKDLHHSGFRILPDDEPAFSFWAEQIPSWAEPFKLEKRGSFSKVRYLLTFRPFGKLPSAIRQAYLEGHLHLLPCPASLIYWGVPGYRQLYREIPSALQVPLLLNVARHRMPHGLRVPQSGFLHEPNADRPKAQSHAGHVRNTFKRTHRWDKILRDADELALITKEDKLLHVLFSTIPDDLSLYDKPMARNVQIWTEDNRLILDGPNASPEQLKEAMHTLEAGGLYGYRFMWPAMRMGHHEIFWHRPLVAYLDMKGRPAVMPDAPLGYLTAYDTREGSLDSPVELWPRLLNRPLPRATLDLHPPIKGRPIQPVVRNIRKLTETYRLLGNQPLPRTLARRLLTLPHGGSLESWLESIPDEEVAAQVHKLIEDEYVALPRVKGSRIPESLTYRRTARRSFEINYWKTIVSLAEGTFLNKNNADCVLDERTQRMLPYHERQLENLGDFLLAYYTRKIATAGLEGKALTGEIPFRWQTDFDYSWMGGWRKNQEAPAERDLLTIIPGRDRKKAIIMADHYDTAYMADRYAENLGVRQSACGADDNHSATAAMMLAAPIFLEMSKKGQLACDIWLIHLTGEEFPADCLGARALTQRLVEGTLKLHLPGGKTRDLSKVVVRGLYVSDMIAHNNDRERDIFQISPGTGADSMWLAYQAHMACEIWNASVPEWNKDPERAGRQPGRRSPHGAAIPEIAPFLSLAGEVRPPDDPRSTLYNTDGQIFSDAGVPCVLFMENYDINRTGYHDTHDTMENIDLDYGSAVCAITIESVARATTYLDLP